MGSHMADVYLFWAPSAGLMEILLQAVGGLRNTIQGADPTIVFGALAIVLFMLVTMFRR